jgi:hypothetical protein
MANAHLENRDQLDAAILSRVLKDNAFRELLMKDPRAALEEVIGSDVPDNIKINVLVESENNFYIILPPGANSPKFAEPSQGELLRAAAAYCTGLTTNISNVNYFTDGICAGSCACCG